MIRRRPGSTLFPYTTLFRSRRARRSVRRRGQGGGALLGGGHGRGRVGGRRRRAAGCRGVGRRTGGTRADERDRKSTRLNSSHSQISYAVFCLKKKNNDGSMHADLASIVYFMNDPTTPGIYTLSLHDALPISPRSPIGAPPRARRWRAARRWTRTRTCRWSTASCGGVPWSWASHRRDTRRRTRSEEHTSELQSQSNLVCRLLLEKKKQRRQYARRPRVDRLFYE